MNTNRNLTFKVVLVGEEGVGKTTWLKRLVVRSKLQTDLFDLIYEPTLGVEVRQVHLRTSIGKITINVWDTAGQERLSGMLDGYYLQANGAIVMADCTNPFTQEKVELLSSRILQTTGRIPIVSVANKIDVDEPLIPHDYCISSRLGISVTEPLYALIKEMVGNHNIVFYE